MSTEVATPVIAVPVEPTVEAAVVAPVVEESAAPAVEEAAAVAKEEPILAEAAAKAPKRSPLGELKNFFASKVGCSLSFGRGTG